MVHPLRPPPSVLASTTCALLAVFAPRAFADAPARLQHVSTLGNVVNNFTKLTHAAWNGHPEAVLLVQPVGVTKNVGVFYDTTSRQWAIFHQDKSPMRSDESFNVVEPGAFVHRATRANSAGGWTRIDHPLANASPMAVLFVTQRWNPSASNGGYNDRTVGVWYEASTKRWAIYNEDRSPMGEGLEFDVKVFATNSSTASPSVDVWRTGPGNTVTSNTLTPPRLTGAGLFFLTHAYNPGGVGGSYLATPWTVASAPERRFRVVTAQGTVPDDLAFDVLTY